MGWCVNSGSLRDVPIFELSVFFYAHRESPMFSSIQTKTKKLLHSRIRKRERHWAKEETRRDETNNRQMPMRMRLLKITKHIREKYKKIKKYEKKTQIPLHQTIVYLMKNSTML